MPTISLATNRVWDYAAAMGKTTLERRQTDRRLAASDPSGDEAAAIAAARADVAAGRVVDEAAMDAWIDGIGTDQERPPPIPVR